MGPQTSSAGTTAGCCQQKLQNCRKTANWIQLLLQKWPAATRIKKHCWSEAHWNQNATRSSQEVVWRNKSLILPQPWGLPLWTYTQIAGLFTSALVCDWLPEVKTGSAPTDWGLGAPSDRSVFWTRTPAEVPAQSCLSSSQTPTSKLS